MIRNVPVLLAVSALVAGCTCNREYTFTPLDEEAEVEDRDFGQWLQMDVAPDGRPVIAYYDLTRTGVGFAVGNVLLNGDIEWEHEEADGYPDAEGLDPGDRGHYLSMTVAPDGHVWASYRDNDNGGLRVAHRVGGLWSNEAADGGTGPIPDGGYWTSIAVDAENSPVVAHYDGSGVLRMARLVDGAWTAETVAEGVDFDDGEVYREASVGKYARLMIHGSTEYLAFYDAAKQSLELLEGGPGNYSQTTVHSDGNVGLWPSLWTDGETLLIGFQDADGGMMLATRTGGGGFSIQSVDEAKMVGSDSELFIRDGLLNIVYFDGFNNDMKHAVQESDGRWTVNIIGETGRAVGFHNEAISLGDGTWLTGSYDYTERELYFRWL